MDSNQLVKQKINTLEEFENICLKNSSGHYHPEKYLKKYDFSPNILLDVFCTDYMVWCYEDYYYNDFSLDMVIEFQPHVNIDEFKIMVRDLDSIFELVKRSELILELFYKNKSIQNITSYCYESIDNYYNYLVNLNKTANKEFDSIVIRDYIDLLKTNKCSVSKKFYNQSSDFLISKEDVVKKAQEILNILPDDEYSLIIPL